MWEQAGSERVKDTKTSNGMLKEAGSINLSLFTLGKVPRTCHRSQELLHTAACGASGAVRACL